MAAGERNSGFIWATGRRKTASARVRLKPNGKGIIKINGRTVEDYFKTDATRKAVIDPLHETKLGNAVDLFINVVGGGTTGQAEAIRMGIARALIELDESYEKALRDDGYLTRDSRMVERKKYGQPGARKRFQFSKR